MVSLINFKSLNELAPDNHQINGAENSQRLTTFSSQPPQQSTDVVVDGGRPFGNHNQQRLEPSHVPKRYHFDQAATIESKPAAESPQLDHSHYDGGNKKSHFEIRWNNLTYEVEPKWYRQKWKALTSGPNSSSVSPSSLDTDSAQGMGTVKILSNLNGSVKSGQVTAILGPSGAGKTSLLGCLTGKHKSGVSGSVQVFSNQTEPLSVCTIPQKDYLLNQLTVRENLWFASRLKHPKDGFDHDFNIERVVELLKLEICLDTKISKISGGQYKRVSIAQELLSNPDILILDEPTSGLDSLTCYKTVMVLRDLARLSPNPVAIIVTIHQPQREVFELFNHVYILAVGGRCIYEGHPSTSIKTINASGSGLHFDADYNPASYLVEIASAEFGEKPIDVLVEQQRREFKQQSQIQDQTNKLEQEQHQLPTFGTPGLMKKRQSPMVMRLKSTLSNLTGSSTTNNANSNGQQQQPQRQQLNTYAYANEAYDTNQAAADPGKYQQQPSEAPGYFEIDASQLASSDNSKQRMGNNLVVSTTTGNIDPISTNEQKLAATYPDELSSSSSSSTPPDDGHFYLDNRLQTHKHNHKGHFFRHCHLLTKRSWLCLCKDPMLTTLRFTAHILVPLLITLVYGSRVGKPNACPLYETDMDLIDYAKHGSKRLLNLQEELRSTFENVGLYFLSIYAFTFSTMCLTSLSFPLNMHVLLKEVRNGWYSIPTYFIGKTLADFPLEFILPGVTLIITYPLTGQPSSYLEWRFLTATSVFIITSLIAQTQGLIFGALFMNAMQAAVFVAPVSTTPLILLSGFLIRISQMPEYLQKLSSFSYFRYAIESLTITRYGFGQCPCDPSVVTGQPVTASGVPDQLRTMTNYWLSTFDVPVGGLNDSLGNNETIEFATTTIAPTAIVAETEQPVDFFQDLTALLARANSFGADIRTCEDLKPYPMIDFGLRDEQLYIWLGALLATLVFFKIINYLVVKFSVKLRL